MANELIDLDAVVSPDIRVKLNDVTYRLPGDAPAEIILRMTHLFSLLAENEAGTEKDFDRVLTLREELGELTLELFQERQPDLDDLRLSDPQIIELLSQLMKHYVGGEDEAADEPRPTVPSAPKKKSARRSARSSAAASTPARSPSSK